jgi:hypothetical protein
MVDGPLPLTFLHNTGMISVPYKVYVIVDRNFGERLAALPEGMPVWIVDTPTNKPVAQMLWKERKDNDHLTGITTFSDNSSLSPEAILISQLDTIELHHGPYSADPPFTQFEMLGASLSEEIRAELFQFGFNEFQPTSEGFRCSRSLGTYQSLPPTPNGRIIAS